MVDITANRFQRSGSVMGTGEAPVVCFVAIHLVFTNVTSKAGDLVNFARTLTGDSRGCSHLQPLDMVPLECTAFQMYPR